MKKTPIFQRGIEKYKKGFFSVFLGVASLILAIISMRGEESELGWKIVIALVVINSIFLITLSLYQGYLTKKSHNANIEIEKKAKLHTDFIRSLLLFSNNTMGALNKFSTQIVSINDRIQEQENEISGLEALTSEDEDVMAQIEAQIESMRKRIDNESIRLLMDEYNHFLGNVLSYLKNILDEWFSVKGLGLKVSISIKQFNRIVEGKDDINDVKIITTFRDNKTYNRKDREIGEIEYRIDANTASRYCLNKPCFIKNNISPDASDYSNENARFKEFYNCTIVAPIVCKYSDMDIFYGYIACDVLNNDDMNKDIFDDYMGDIMIVAGKIIGMYFDEIDYQWDAIMVRHEPPNDDFLASIYQNKLKVV